MGAQSVTHGALQAQQLPPPWMAPWADTCYRFDSNLLIGSSQILSQRGVQQRNPLGPSLFALAIHPCIIEAISVTESLHPGDLGFKPFFLNNK